MKTNASIIKDIQSLGPFIEQASQYDSGAPTRFYFKNMSYSIKRKKCDKTSTGKDPKYAYTCTVDITDIPVSPDLVDDYLDLMDVASPQEQVRLNRIMDREINRSTDSLIIHLSYKTDGTVGKSRIYYWHEKMCHIIFLSEKKGELSLSKVARKHLDDKKETVLFKRP